MAGVGGDGESSDSETPLTKGTQEKLDETLTDQLGQFQ